MEMPSGRPTSMAISVEAITSDSVSIIGPQRAM